MDKPQLFKKKEPVVKKGPDEAPKKVPPQVPTDSEAKINVKAKPTGGLESRVDLNPSISFTKEEDDVKESLAGSIDLAVLNEIFDGDLSDIDDYDLTGLAEGISVAARYRKRIIIRRYKNKIAVSRRRSMGRRAPQRVIQKRARRMAVTQIKRRFTQGRPTKSLSFSERSRVEGLIKKRRPAVARLGRRLVRQARNNETRRLHNSYEIEVKDVNMLFEVFQQLMEASTDLTTLATGSACTVSITKKAKKEWDKSGAPVSDTAKVLMNIKRVAEHGVDGVQKNDDFKTEGCHWSGGDKGKGVVVWVFRQFQLRVYGGFVTGRHFIITSVLIKKTPGIPQTHLGNVALDLGYYM